MPNIDEDFEKENSGKISVLIIEPMKEPYAQEIDSGLASLQKAVGGDIEAVYPYDDPVALVCNEEGKLNGLQLNRALRAEDGEVYDIIAGTFMVTGLTDDNFGSLSPELQQKYAEQFKQPEMFAQINGKIAVIPVVPETEQEHKKTLDIYQIKDDELGKKMSFMPGTVALRLRNSGSHSPDCWSYRAGIFRMSPYAFSSALTSIGMRRKEPIVGT